MPMPHRTFAQLAKRRLIGKEGRERVREVNALLAELPDYRNGPYADLRKALLAELEETRTRSSAVHRDSIAVRREGAAQVALVGPPNVGKSSVLQALSEIQIRTGDYAFTTLRPVPAVTRIGGVLVQLVEIPGLIAGASEDRAGGRALLGVLRSADAIVYCTRAGADPAELRVVMHEVAAAGIDKPAVIAATRADEAPASAVAVLAAAFPGFPVMPVSVLDEASLDRFRDEVWRLTGLVRIRLRVGDVVDEPPIALHPPATIVDVADQVHHDLAAAAIGARVWGPSARFDGQRVGRDHEVSDGDVLEILRDALARSHPGPAQARRGGSAAPSAAAAPGVVRRQSRSRRASRSTRRARVDRLRRLDDRADHAVGDVVRRRDADVRQPNCLEPGAELRERQGAGDAARVRAPLGSLRRRQPVLGDDVGHAHPAARLEHPRDLAEHRRLVGGEVDHAVADHDVDRVRRAAGSPRSCP